MCSGIQGTLRNFAARCRAKSGRGRWKDLVCVVDFLITGPARGSLGFSLGRYGPFGIVTSTRDASTHKHRSLVRKEADDLPFPRELSYQSPGLLCSPLSRLKPYRQIPAAGWFSLLYCSSQR